MLSKELEQSKDGSSLCSVLAGTGHRLNTLGYDKGPALVSYLVQVLPSYNPSKLISGMADGFDQALAEAAIQLQIPFIAAVPFKGQESRWPEEHKQHYHKLLEAASEVVIVSEGGYATWKYFKRDEWMVKAGTSLLALWDGRKHGGTYQTIKYAETDHKPVVNLWPGWETYGTPATN